MSTPMHSGLLYVHPGALFVDEHTEAFRALCRVYTYTKVQYFCALQCTLYTYPEVKLMFLCTLVNTLVKVYRIVPIRYKNIINLY